ncbi:hypothetical protein BT96DRAFT_661070 [Gymnopus androsaceus JB14]|uniref:Uncharacterized protein n=1 Tax=Gymnopus androsaceus JB14 TaxID=1447944 RepID=A0A6A4HSW3_9AGAR|nr:hypothetical protein BT96DRAFT_661070 [Gymnopus androsaceus JB14]
MWRETCLGVNRDGQRCLQAPGPRVSGCWGYWNWPKRFIDMESMSTWINNESG